MPRRTANRMSKMPRHNPYQIIWQLTRAMHSTLSPSQSFCVYSLAHYTKHNPEAWALVQRVLLSIGTLCMQSDSNNKTKRRPSSFAFEIQCFFCSSVAGYCVCVLCMNQQNFFQQQEQQQHQILRLSFCPYSVPLKRIVVDACKTKRKIIFDTSSFFRTDRLYGGCAHSFICIDTLPTMCSFFCISISQQSHRDDD